MTVWRQRLDVTGNWAILLIVALTRIEARGDGWVVVDRHFSFLVDPGGVAT